MQPIEFAHENKLTYVLIPTGVMVNGQKIYEAWLINLKSEPETCLFPLESYKPAAIYQKDGLPPEWAVWDEILDYEATYAAQLHDHELNELYPNYSEDNSNHLGHARNFRDWLNNDGAWNDLFNLVDYGAPHA